MTEAELLEGKVFEFPNSKTPFKVFFDQEKKRFTIDFFGRKKTMRNAYYKVTAATIEKLSFFYDFSYHPITIEHARRIFRKGGEVYYADVKKKRHIQVRSRNVFLREKLFLIK